MNKDKKLEKAIENLEKQLKHTKKASECGVATKGEFKEDIQAIETVLEALENYKQEIQNLKYKLQLVGMKVINKRSNTVGIVLHQWENGSIAVLEKIEPTIINTHDSWKTLDIIISDIINHKTKK